MSHLIICRGIPGSGKSYWAAQQADCVVVTRDDIRLRYNCIGEGWSKQMELDFIIPEMNTQIRDALLAGHTVISADTNVNPKAVLHLIDLAHSCGATIEIKEFDTPLAICIERDSQRVAPFKVGAEKLREYAELWTKRNAVSA